MVCHFFPKAHAIVSELTVQTIARIGIYVKDIVLAIHSLARIDIFRKEIDSLGYTSLTRIHTYMKETYFLDISAQADMVM